MKKIKDKEFPLMKKQQESLKNMVYQAILNGIFTDEYKPNQIINEQELVQKFGCSKTSMTASASSSSIPCVIAFSTIG